MTKASFQIVQNDIPTCWCGIIICFEHNVCPCNWVLQKWIRPPSSDGIGHVLETAGETRNLVQSISGPAIPDQGFGKVIIFSSVVKNFYQFDRRTSPEPLPGTITALLMVLIVPRVETTGQCPSDEPWRSACCKNSSESTRPKKLSRFTCRSSWEAAAVSCLEGMTT